MRSTIFLVHDPIDGEFVHAFADKLRGRGFEVATDRWAVSPEEGLIDRIFGEGLKSCSVFVVVVSKVSESQQWLRAELDATTVARVQRHVGIVTLLLDDRLVPVSLAGTQVEAVQDRMLFEAAAVLVGDVAYRSMYPGGGPGFDDNLPVIEGLSRLQSALLKTTCDYLKERDGETVHPERALPTDKWGWLSEDELLRNLEELEEKGLMRVFRFLTGGFHFGPTRAGFEAWCQTYLPDYQEILKAFASAVVNEELTLNTEIAQRIRAPQRIVNHIIDVLEERKMIKTTRFIDSIKVQNASSSLRSLLWFQADGSPQNAPPVQKMPAQKPAQHSTAAPAKPRR